MRHSAGARRGSSGQSLVEFALVAPLFFLLLFGLIEFGRAVYTIQMLDNAAREGARYAIVHGAESTCPSGPMPNGDANYCDPSGTKIAARVRESAIGVSGLTSGDLTVTSRWCSNIATCTSGLGNGTNARNQSITVRVAYSYRPLVPLVPLPDFTLTGGSTLVINH